MADDRTSFVVRMPVEQHRRLRSYAARQDRSMSSVVRLALAQLLEEEEEVTGHPQAV